MLARQLLRLSLRHAQRSVATALSQRSLSLVASSKLACVRAVAPSRVLSSVCLQPRWRLLTTSRSLLASTANNNAAGKAADSARASKVEEEEEEEEDDDPNDEKMEKLSMRERLQAFMRKYGRAAIFTYITIDITFFAATYGALASGVDVTGILHTLRIPTLLECTTQQEFQMHQTNIVLCSHGV